MLISEIQVPVTNIAGVGSAVAAQLQKLGAENIGGLLRLFPRAWEDRTRVNTFSEWNRFQKLNAEITVTGHQWFGFGKMKTLKLIVMDKAGQYASLICFNRPFLEKAFPAGTRGFVYGSFYRKYGELQASSFELEKDGANQMKILPVYPLTAGLGQAKMRKIVAAALKLYARGIDSELPAEVLQKYNLPPKQDVLFMLHAPKSMQEAECGKYALIFEEFFLFQYAVGYRSIERRGRLPGTESSSETDRQPNAEFVPSPLQARLLERLPFKLTEDQRAAAAEMNKDLDGINPMARLLQGDVGSGKTITAFLACLKVIEQGGQTAFLAPTELLARQHAENAAKLLEPIGVRLAFLTGSTKARGRSALLSELEKGNIDLILGTHSLFSTNVNYKNLRLAVIDEQHRFGVLQRSAILQKGADSNIEKRQPHILMMSATPIPRTLALSVFGDLDISSIKTLPSGRKPIITYVGEEGKAEKVYALVAAELEKGRQAYFVYPLIEENEELSLKSAQKMFENLQNRFSAYRLALIHSKIKEDEQRGIMEEFKAGTIDILVATSVVEVGVDVPNASCMVIEQAERFGLSALHQLRGRVGRGSEQSYCFLIYGKGLTENGRERLKIMKETNDGFIIAEKDLKLRGPGDIGGIEQSGYLGFTFADPIRDYEILQRARTAAFDMLKERQ